MISSIQNDTKFIWEYYIKRLAFVDDDEFISASNEEISDFLKLSYDNLQKQLVNKAKVQGKTAKQLKYEDVKLRRTIARLVGEGVLTGDFTISYSERDILNEFPIFDKKNIEVCPTDKTINRLKVKIIQTNIDAYNQEARENGKKEITDLRGVRNFLIGGLKIDAQKATILTKIYGAVSASQTAWNIK